MFNLSGSELIFLILIALVVLGPDKLPDAMRKAGKAYADFKKMTSGFQNEMKSVLEEPMRELRETADLAKKSAMWDMNADATPSSPRQAPAAAEPAPVEPVMTVPAPVEPAAVEPSADETRAVEPLADEPPVEPLIEPAVEQSGDDEVASA